MEGPRDGTELSRVVTEPQEGSAWKGPRASSGPTSLPAQAQTLLEYLVTPWAYLNSTNSRDKGCLWVALAVSLNSLQVSYTTVKLIRKKKKKGNF